MNNNHRKTVPDDSVWYTKPHLVAISGLVATIASAIQAAKEFAAGGPATWTWVAVILGVLGIIQCIYIIWAKQIAASTIITNWKEEVKQNQAFKYSKTSRGLALLILLLIVILSASAFYWKLQFIKELKFSKNDFGILVLKIDGDSDGSLSKELLHTLENEVARSLVNGKISIRFQDISVEASLDLKNAHQKARQIGKQYNAQIVYWGATSGGKRFFPRITVVNYNAWQLGVLSELTLDNQDVSELNLPVSLVTESASLAYFVMGFAYFINNNCNDALVFFERGLMPDRIYDPFKPDFLYFAGCCYLELGMKGINIENNFQLAIQDLQNSIPFYQKAHLDSHVARSMASLGLAFLCLKSGSSDDNLNQAIQNFQIALGFYSESNLPNMWAAIEFNLGAAFARSHKFDKATTAFNSALHFYNKSNHPSEWLNTQFSLCLAYNNCAGSSGNINLQKSIDAGELALQLISDTSDPIRWSTIESMLCLSYEDLHSSNSIQKSIAAGEAALRIITLKDSSFSWALIEASLCGSYLSFQFGNENENIKKAIEHGEAALLYYSETNNPDMWAKIQGYLGDAYSKMPYGKPVDDINKSIEHYEFALHVYSQTNNPATCEIMQYNLCTLNAGLARSELTSTYITNFESMNIFTMHVNKAIIAGESALSLMKSSSENTRYYGVLNNLTYFYLFQLQNGQVSKNSILKAKYYNDIILRSCPRDRFPEIYDSAMKMKNIVN